MDIREFIKGEVRWITNGSGDIWDEENNHIAVARGWGHIQYLDNPDKKLDSLTNFITEAINEKLARDENKKP